MKTFIFSMGLCLNLMLPTFAEDYLPLLSEVTACQWARAVGAIAGKAAEQLRSSYENGTLLECDDAKACKSMEMAKKHAAQLTALGRFYMKGRGGPKDYAKAAECYRRGGEAGCSLAWVELADLYESGLGVPKDYAEARKLLERAGRGYAKACYDLGRYYEKGLGGETNLVEAIKCYEAVFNANVYSDEVCQKALGRL